MANEKSADTAGELAHGTLNIAPGGADRTRQRLEWPGESRINLVAERYRQGGDGGNGNADPTDRGCGGKRNSDRGSKQDQTADRGGDTADDDR
jgi:hypothetical protein